ncbi:MAG: ABC transporter substrate-binding protein [Chloroflexi bacterium]|nr:ABC transporter substrate-binding protein [Chloroflexota bacterium]
MAATTSSRGGPAVDARSVVVPTLRLPTCYDPDQFTRVAPWRSMVNWDVHVQLYDQLLRYPTVDVDGRPVQDVTRFGPMLAQGFDVSGDGRRYRVALRPGVTSEHGHELTADDVVWSWAALQEPAGAPRPPEVNWLTTGVHGEVGRWVAFMGSAYEAIPGSGAPAVRALDRYSVEFALPEPNAAFPHILTMTVPPIYDSTEASRHATPEDPYARDWLAGNPGGFGRYAVESRAEDELVLHARADHYAGMPAIERVLYRVLPEGRDRVDALVAGEIDVVFQPSPAEAERVAGHPDLALFRAPGNSQLSLQMDPRVAPFDDVHVRRALAAAVPYREIVDDVLRGFGRPWRGVVPETSLGYLELWPGEQDLERAREELRASGRDRVRATLHHGTGDPVHAEVAQRVAREAGTVGIDLDVRPMAGGELSDLQKEYRMPLAVAGGGHRCNEMGYAVPHDFGDRYFGITNWIDYQNPRVNELILEIRRTGDAGRRRALIHETQRIVAEDQPWAFIAQPDFLVAHRRGLQGFAWRSRSGNRLAYYDLRWESASG